eukprot:COSAG04_NODE_13736_length_594_cov_0.648485_1_plen_75_part_00
MFSPPKHQRCSLQNYQEVGGGDVAVLVGLGNTLANIPAVLLPALGLVLRRRFGGSFAPLFAVVAALQCSAFGLF